MLRDLGLSRVFADDLIDGLAQQGAHGNHRAAGNFPELHEPVGVDIKTGLCLPGFSRHGTKRSIMQDIGALITLFLVHSSPVTEQSEGADSSACQPKNQSASSKSVTRFA